MKLMNFIFIIKLIAQSNIITQEKLSLICLIANIYQDEKDEGKFSFSFFFIFVFFFHQ